MTTIPSIVEGQAQPATKANENFAAVAPAGIFGKKASTTTGLTFGYLGGVIEVAGVLTTISDGTVSLTNGTTNYVEVNRAGTVSTNTTGFTAGSTPLYEIVTASSAISSITDRRIVFNQKGAQTLAKTWPSDASYTLSDAEARASHIRLSGATLTATRDLLVPANWSGFVYNGTGGSQSVRVVESGSPQGSGVTIANGSGARVYGDGTNIYRETPDT